MSMPWVWSGGITGFCIILKFGRDLKGKKKKEEGKDRVRFKNTIN